MNKKLLTIILGIFLLVSATAIITLSNGDKYISAEELSQLSDQQIQNYLQNNFECGDETLLKDKMRIRCNITYIEPTHSDYTHTDENNQTHTVIKPYRSFTQETNFYISNELREKCLNHTTENKCIGYLKTNTEPFYLIENNSYIKEITEYNNVSREREIETFDEFGNLTIVNETYYELEPYQVNKTFYEVTNTTIKSVKLQAMEFQIYQFDRIKDFRDLERDGHPMEDLL
jgi:hypothetical protein